MSSRDWQSAISDFQTAAKLDQTRSDPWLFLGRIYERTGQKEELWNAWDKAIALGGNVALAVCLGRPSKSCERGVLSLSGSSVEFAVNGKRVFSSAPGEFNPDSAPNNHEYGFQASGIRYNFDFFPDGVNWAYNKVMVQCPTEGVSKQVMLAQYVAQALPKLSRGAR